MKIVAIQPMGPHLICIMDTGEGISKNDIEGEVRKGVEVKLIDGKYKVTGAAPEECAA